MDTVTLVRSAIRGLLKVAGGELESAAAGGAGPRGRLRGRGQAGRVTTTTRPARAELVDALARDGMALLAVLDGRELSEALTQAAALLATVLGQDLEQDETGVFRIARRVAKDRVISTVDPQTRHGHKTAARGFDGYKGHVGIDPDTEIITATTVTAGNAGDASVAEDLITDLLDTDDTDTRHTDAGHRPGDDSDSGGEPAASVYGDNAYGTGELHDTAGTGRDRVQVQDPAAGRCGRAASPRTASTSTCATTRCAVPPGTPHRSGAARAPAPPASGRTAPTARCASSAPPPPTDAPSPSGSYERQLADARARQRDPDWITDYRATRPKVERKIAHLMRRRHGGRRARVRGTSQDRRRLRPARRRRQPRTPRRAGPGQRPRIRMGHRDPMSRAGR